MEKKLNKIALMGVAMALLAVGLFFIFCECESLALSLLSKPVGVGALVLFVLVWPGEITPVGDADEDFFC